MGRGGGCIYPPPPNTDMAKVPFLYHWANRSRYIFPGVSLP